MPNVYFRASVSSYVNGSTIGCRKHLRLLKRLSDKDIDWIFETLSEDLQVSSVRLDDYGEFEDGEIYKLEMDYSYDHEYGWDLDGIRFVKVDPKNLINKLTGEGNE